MTQQRDSVPMDDFVMWLVLVALLAFIFGVAVQATTEYLKARAALPDPQVFVCYPAMAPGSISQCELMEFTELEERDGRP